MIGAETSPPPARSEIESDRDDWGHPPHGVRRRGAAPAAVLLALLVVGTAVSGVWNSVAGAAVASAGAAAAAGWVAVQGHRVLRASGARRLDPAEWPRLANLVAGLAADVGTPPPSLWIVGGGANALVCRARGPCLAVSRALLESCTRTELEAVAAHCLVRLARSKLRWESVSAAFGPLGPRRLVTPADDARAAALTRYPPALASALVRAELPPRLAAFWFAAAPPTHAPRPERLEALAQL
jgi:hypothetical protein